MSITKSLEKNLDCVLRVGSRIEIVSPALPFLWFLKRCQLTYAGMPTKDTFSLALSTSIVYNSETVNLYYPANARRLEIEGIGLEIAELTPEEIRFRLHREP